MIAFLRDDKEGCDAEGKRSGRIRSSLTGCTERINEYINIFTPVVGVDR